MVSLSSLGTVCLFLLAGLVLWPSRRAQRCLLTLLAISLRLLLTIAVLALAFVIDKHDAVGDAHLVGMPTRR